MPFGLPWEDPSPSDSLNLLFASPAPGEHTLRGSYSDKLLPWVSELPCQPWCPLRAHLARPGPEAAGLQGLPQ